MKPHVFFKNQIEYDDGIEILGHTFDRGDGYLGIINALILRLTLQVEIYQSQNNKGKKHNDKIGALNYIKHELELVDSRLAIIKLIINGHFTKNNPELSKYACASSGFFSTTTKSLINKTNELLTHIANRTIR